MDEIYRSFEPLEKQASEEMLIRTLLDSVDNSLYIDFIQALKYAEKAYTLSQGLENIELKMFSTLKFATTYFYKGFYVQSINLSYELLDLSNRAKEPVWKAQAYILLGNHKLVNENFLEAESYYQRARNILNAFSGSDNPQVRHLEIKLYNNFGVINSKYGAYNKANEAFISGISLAKTDRKYAVDHARILSNMGDNLSSQGLFLEALAFYEKGIAVLGEGPDTVMKSMLYNALGKLYMNLNRYPEAIENFKLGFEMAKSAHAYSHLRHLSEGLSIVYGNLKMADSAFFYSNLSRSYFDSLRINQASDKMLIEELAGVFDQEKSELSFFYEKKQSLLLAMSIIFLLVIVLLIVKVIGNNQQQKGLEKLIVPHLSMRESDKDKGEEISDEHLANSKTVTKDQTVDVISPLSDKAGVMADAKLQGYLKKMLLEVNDARRNTFLREFEFNFARAYPGFIEKLNRTYPDLTPNDRRLCAFMKLQLATKEIAQITAKSNRAVEMGRIRLRKKLGLTNSGENLYSFFSNF